MELVEVVGSGTRHSGTLDAQRRSVAADSTRGRVHLRDWRHMWVFTIAFFLVAVVAGGLTLAFEADGSVPARAAGAVAAGFVVAPIVPFRRGSHARWSRRTSTPTGTPKG